MNKLTIFAFNTVRAPYRIDLYNQLGKYFNFYAFFEQKHDPVRSFDWYSDNYINFKMLHSKKWDKSLRYPKFDVLKALKKTECDLVYMSEWCTITSMILILKCIALKIPYILSMDGYIKKEASKFNKFKFRIKHFFAKYAAATIGTGNSTENYAKSIGFEDDKIFSIGFTSLFEKDIVKQPASNEEKSDLKKKLGLKTEKKYILSIGQLVRRKGFDLLLEAWNSIEVKSNWELLIIGDGEEKDDYLKLISDKEISSVSIISGKEKDELFDYYKAADIFVLNTREDIWGLVINEAMANGLPIITTNQCVSGIELIEEGNNGFLNNCYDIRSLNENLIRLMKDSNLRTKIGENNISKIKKFTIESESEKIAEVIRKVVMDI